MDLDEILPDVGEFGTYQQLVLYFILLPGVLPCGFHAYNQIFMAASPDHWCRVPQLEERNLTLDQILNYRCLQL
jgi:MFS transporter, OCT family, solute carrier family 22 (organic cation transporter), member 4/5